jgi:hypothetical protein
MPWAAGDPHLFHGSRVCRSKGGGNWIALDFSGLIFWTYITLLAIHFVLSSIGVVSFPKSGALRIHFWSMMLFRHSARHRFRRLRKAAALTGYHQSTANFNPDNS